MTDETEEYRRQKQVELNSPAANREKLEAEYGKVYDTEQLTNEFDVIGFMAPFAVVKRRSDGVKGSVAFQHWPRFYFSFKEDK